MARIDNSAFSTVQQFLSAVCGYAVPNIRSADEFCVAFTPELIMERIEDAELRANILYATAGTRIEVARRTSKESAGEQMKIALAEKLVAPEVVLELLNPDYRVQYLDGPKLWAFVIEKRSWETYDGPGEAKAAKGLVALILETALKIGLVTPEEIVRSISFVSFFEKESKPRLVDSFEAFADAQPGKGFDVLLGRYSPIAMVESIALDVIWDRVIHPLVAVRNGLTPAQVDAGAAASSVAQGSSPSAPPSPTGSLSKKEGTTSVTGSIARPSVSAGAHVSSVPAASRIGGGPQSNQEGDSKDPKGHEASDQENADADDMVVGDDDIIAAAPTAPGAGSSPNVQVPRPKSDGRQHPTGDANVEMVVEHVSLSDPDIRAALREEPAVDGANAASTRNRTNTGSFTPENGVSRAGGANRSDPPATSRPSATPMSSKAAVYDLLRSGDNGLKLANIDLATCRIHQLIIAALEEIDPSTYGGEHQRFAEANKLDLGNILCSEIEKRNTRISGRLRQILGNIGCATKITPSSAPSSIRPPPLPTSKSPQSNPSSSEQRISQVPQAEKKS